MEHIQCHARENIPKKSDGKHVTTAKLEQTTFDLHVSILQKTQQWKFKNQSVDRKKGHRRILEDLNRIRSKAEEVWGKIGKGFFL